MGRNRRRRPTRQREKGPHRRHVRRDPTQAAIPRARSVGDRGRADQQADRGRSIPGRIACYAWASPTTLLGLIAGVLTLGSGGGGRVRRGALEFHGGFARWFGDRIGFNAMTLGHVILGRSASVLDDLRDHEQAHVRQAERWGPAFIPAYLVASYMAHRRGGHYYRDNWFEQDARRAAGESI
ncbi:hypothetical protein [Aquisphaera insulae]|uniref:hypothetical protein n=1 Tax=Aquisphaera insulae TaxID=2712864 RepID=UPI00202F4189|nr:hypothetical protein [Aquisphaera insulae]